MAYNILKGVIEGSVDQHADQEIDGVKVFKNTISASVFYDTDAQSPCATMKDVAIKKIVGGGKDRLFTLNGDTARAHHMLTFDGSNLKTRNVHASEYHGSAKHLTDLPANSFVGKVNADSLNLGHGTHAVRGALQVRGRQGILVEEDGVSLDLHSGGGLIFRDSKLYIDAQKVAPINTNGQNLSDGDIVMVSDVSHNKLASTSLSNLYDGYIRNKVSHPTGDIGDVQIRGKDGFSASSNLSYNLGTRVLRVDGAVNTETLKVATGTHFNGSVHHTIRSITSRIYEMQNDDYTLLCDTQKSPITVMLPPACNNKGRVLNIKKANSDKYKINSYPVILKVAEGSIDLSDEAIIKTNYSSRSVQSDGENWWIISSKGT